MALPSFVFSLGAIPYDLMTAHPVWRQHCADMASYFPDSPSGRRTVLDLGCGPGVSALALADRCPQDCIVGLDYVHAMVARAVKHDTRRQCQWLQGDAHALPFADQSVDAVTGHSFLYLLRDRARVLSEIRRVLRPGGSLVLLEPNGQTVWNDSVSVFKTLQSWGPHLAFTFAAWRMAARTSGAFTQTTLTDLLRQQGFQSVAVEPAFHGLGLTASASR